MNGVGTLIRAALRRDRWMILWWSLGTMVLYVSQAWSVDGLYRTPEEFRRAARSMGSNTAFIAMTGPARALDTIGGQVTWQATAYGAISVALMSMFLIGRHTRAEEESGRDELVRAAPVDRHAPMLAALVVAMIAAAICGALVAAGLIAYPLAPADSIALGAGLMITGWLFAAVTLLAAQITSGTRAAYAITGTAIGAAYVVRAVGDVSAGWLSWLSPIGWYQAMHQFSGLRWWPALIAAVACALVVTVAHAVFDRRDFGAGVLVERPGPATASPRLTSASGLAWRLQRASVAGWTAGMLVLGLAYGSFGTDVGTLVGDSAAANDIFGVAGADLTDAFYAVMAVILGVIAAGFAVSSALRPRAEEERGRLEPLLATGLPRRRWLGANLAVTAIGVTCAVVAAAVGMGLAFGLAGGGWGDAVRLGGATLQQIAPVLVLAGATLLLYGIRARLALLGWLGVAFCAVVVVFGDLLRIPGGIQDLSPFEHLALMPARPFRPVALLAVAALAALLHAGSLLAFRGRDVR